MSRQASKVIDGVEMYSNQDLASVLGVTTASVRRMIREGRVEAIKDDGGHWFTPVTEVRRVVAERNKIIMPPDVPTE